MNMLRCPHCKSKKVTKNGHTRHQKQNYECQKCYSQFSENPQNRKISESQKAQIRKLLLERLSLSGICRVIGCSLRWLLSFIVEIYRELPHDLNIKIRRANKACLIRLNIEADEMWSFVGKKENKQWIWLALDPDTKQIIGYHVGDRSQESAKALFNSLPAIYRNQADFYTDDYASYKGVIPPNRHFVSKAQTNHIERFNLTLRQRVSRLVRKNLAFSKKLINHIGAIKYFICHYNLQLV